VFAGFIELPHTLGHVQLFSDYLSPVLPEVILKPGIESAEWIVQLIAGGLSLIGVAAAYYFYIQSPSSLQVIKREMRDTYTFWFNGWGLDTLYNKVFVHPFVWLANANKGDLVDNVYTSLVSTANLFHRLFAWTQSGILRWYMMGIVVGTILVVTLSLLVV
jgi:NADH-quinone oxidoreductase subunit L